MFRTATRQDLEAVMQLLSLGIRTRELRPLNWEELEKSIHTFRVTGNPIEACGSLSSNGELRKIMINPGIHRGLGSLIVSDLLNEARKLHFPYVYGVTINPRMGRIFEIHGFYPISRTQLPLEWQIAYDWSRPSKAYKLIFPYEK